MVFEVGIGTSQNWNPEEAATEVITQALSKLTKPPTFVLLFSTIHHEKNKGFQKILNTIYTQIPKETPLVGGTVTGFINNDGAYTRGLTALACNSDEIETATGIGHNTKRNPKKAAQACSKTIKNILDKSTKGNKFVFENISNGTVPPTPFLGRRRIIKVPFASKILVKLLELVNIVFQYGVGRDNEVLDELSKLLPDYKILSIANYDDNKSISNFQFHNSTISKNTVSALAFDTTANVAISSSLGLKQTEITFNIDDLGLFGCAFGKIDGKPATKQILKILGWPEGYLNERIYRRTYYYPIGYLENNTLFPHTIGLFLGDYICCTYKLNKKEMRVFDASGYSLMESIEKNLTDSTANKKVHFLIGSACTSILETFGSKIYKIQKKFSDVLQRDPFIIVFGAGEGAHTPKEEALYFNHSLITATVYDNINT